MQAGEWDIAPSVRKEREQEMLAFSLPFLPPLFIWFRTPSMDAARIQSVSIFWSWTSLETTLYTHPEVCLLGDSKPNQADMKLLCQNEVFFYFAIRFSMIPWEQTGWMMGGLIFVGEKPQLEAKPTCVVCTHHQRKGGRVSCKQLGIIKTLVWNQHWVHSGLLGQKTASFGLSTPSSVLS